MPLAALIACAGLAYQTHMSSSPSGRGLLIRCIAMYQAAPQLSYRATERSTLMADVTVRLYALDEVSDGHGTAGKRYESIEMKVPKSLAHTIYIDDGNTEYQVMSDIRRFTRAKHRPVRMAEPLRQLLLETPVTEELTVSESSRAGAPVYVIKGLRLDGSSRFERTIILDKASLQLLSIRRTSNVGIISEFTVDRQSTTEKLPSSRFEWSRPSGYLEGALQR